MNTDKTIVLRKRMAATKVQDEDGTPIQLLGSGYINRWSNGEGCEPSPDAAYFPRLLEDLDYDEGEVEVDVTISLEPFNQAREMWCFGDKVEGRVISPYKPTKKTRKGKTLYSVRGSFFYLDCFWDKRYFEQIPGGEIFPVYISVKRVEK